MCHAVALAPHGAKGLKALQVTEPTTALPLLLPVILTLTPWRVSILVSHYQQKTLNVYIYFRVIKYVSRYCFVASGYRKVRNKGD